VEPPAHGKVTVKKGNFNATNYKQCLALNVLAYVAFYRSENDFFGSDSVLLEVRYPSGNKNCNISLSPCGSWCRSTGLTIQFGTPVSTIIRRAT